MTLAFLLQRSVNRLCPSTMLRMVPLPGSGRILWSERCVWASVIMAEP